MHTYFSGRSAVLKFCSLKNKILQQQIQRDLHVTLCLNSSDIHIDPSLKCNHHLHIINNEHNVFFIHVHSLLTHDSLQLYQRNAVKPSSVMTRQLEKGAQSKATSYPISGNEI